MERRSRSDGRVAGVQVDRVQPSTNRFRVRKHLLARRTERLFFAAGVALLTVFLAAHVHRMVAFHASMKDFENARHGPAAPPPVVGPALAADAPGDPEANAGEAPALPVRGNKAAVAVHRASNLPLAILRIPKIHLEVPVLNGTDEITLNRGVGKIAGTAAPGEKGNIGIAGHRDSFFRELKDLNQGDAIELETPGGSETYIIDVILITEADDISVLHPRNTQSLTLVTCYPFTYIGPAPRRFVVQATLK
jgi:sortase A